MYTKGAVLLMCFQCVDTLAFVLKQSICCDAICALAYCGRHESSHIIKVHTDSTRFKKKMVCGNLWKFVADFLENRLHGLYVYVGFVESC